MTSKPPQPGSIYTLKKELLKYRGGTKTMKKKGKHKVIIALALV